MIAALTLLLVFQLVGEVIARALAHTSGRRIEAALALGIGRNTITRKIQELGLEGGRGDEGEHA